VFSCNINSFVIIIHFLIFAVNPQLVPVIWFVVILKIGISIVSTE